MTNTSNTLVPFYISTVETCLYSLRNKKQPHKSTTLSVKNFMMLGALILSIVIISDEKQLKLFNMKKEGGGIVGNGCFFYLPSGHHLHMPFGVFHVGLEDIS